MLLHAMIGLKNFNKAVIVTGDGDFHCLVEYLTKHNKLKKLLVPNRHAFSSLLRKFSAYMAAMNLSLIHI